MLTQVFKPRDPDEHGRAATPLELLFDLVSVIAIASAAAGLHHSVSHGHFLQGILIFLIAFFAIWWAWMNYTWYASAYDNDDTLFRLLTFVIMTGALVMAASIDVVFRSFDLRMVTLGYVVMRLGMILLWLRAARGDPLRRNTALTYALGIGLVQIYWVGFLVVQPEDTSLKLGLIFIGIVMELLVPVIAERKTATPWHRHHMVERYGLLNIIVLGETLLAGSLALQQIADGSSKPAHIQIAASAMVIVASIWWLYFSKEDHLDSRELKRTMVWAYGHFIIFAAGAAIGSGISVLVEVASGHSKISLLTGNMAVGIPVALYILGLWFVRDRYILSGATQLVLPVFAGLVLLALNLPFALEVIAGLTALCVIVRNRFINSNPALSP